MSCSSCASQVGGESKSTSASQSQIHGQKRRIQRSGAPVYGVFDCDFDFESREWVRSSSVVRSQKIIYLCGARRCLSSYFSTSDEITSPSACTCRSICMYPISPPVLGVAPVLRDVVHNEGDNNHDGRPSRCRYEDKSEPERAGCALCCHSNERRPTRGWMCGSGQLLRQEREKGRVRVKGYGVNI